MEVCVTLSVFTHGDTPLLVVEYLDISYFFIY